MDAEAKRDLEWSEPIMVCPNHGQVTEDRIVQSHFPVVEACRPTFMQVCRECNDKLKIFH